MSAYVVSSETMNLILAGLSDATGKLGKIPLPMPPEILRFEWGAETGRADAMRVGRVLLKMNIEAVSDRYGEKAQTELLFAFRPAPTTSTVWAFYKALCCYRYQCSEGAITERPVFVALDGYCGEVAERIAKQTAEYENAEGWG